MPRALNIAGKRLVIKQEATIGPFFRSLAFECVHTCILICVLRVCRGVCGHVTLHRLPCPYTLLQLLLLTSWYHSLVGNDSSFRLLIQETNIISRRLLLTAIHAGSAR